LAFLENSIFSEAPVDKTQPGIGPVWDLTRDSSTAYEFPQRLCPVFGVQSRERNCNPKRYRRRKEPKPTLLNLMGDKRDADR
jgi:hypothetical protein